MFISVTTYLEAPYTSWITGRGSGQPFVVSANITYAEQRYLYPLLHLHYCKQNQNVYIETPVLYKVLKFEISVNC